MPTILKPDCLRAAGAVLSLAVASSALAAPTYYGSTTFTQPTAVADDGTVAGIFGSDIGLWNPGAGLGETSIGGRGVGTPGLSADARYVGGSNDGADQRTEIARYDRTTAAWTNLGGAGGNTSSTRSVGYGISGDGSTVVGFGYGTPTGTATFTGVRPISVNAATGFVTDYSFIPNATGANRITAANSDGSVVAGIARTTTALGSFVWNGTTPTPIYAEGTTTYLADPAALSADGRVVAGNGNAATNFVDDGINTRRPYLFDQVTGGVITIESVAGDNGNPTTVTGPNPIDRIDGLLGGLTADGNTAVGFFRGSAGGSPFIDKQWGFLWTRDGGAVSIDLYAASLGLDAASDVYLLPTAISPDGGSIAGLQFSRSGAGGLTSFTITGLPVPEPTSLAGVALLSVLALRRRR